ncbi:MAG: DUF615 domain-containing protein [Desulfobacterales bacterium]|nr:DUF615 domain-containing protein [Desulfobacterales bacterium]
MEPISRTKKKKEAEHLQLLGEKLVKLPAEQLEEMALPGEIHKAVIFAKTIKKHGALRRQMQYIGKLMRNFDVEPIQEALHHIELGSYEKALAFKELERWRDELVAGNKALIEEILTKCPDADRQQLSQLARNAAKEKLKDKPPKASRSLFRYLKKISN